MRDNGCSNKGVFMGFFDLFKKKEAPVEVAPEASAPVENNEVMPQAPAEEPPASPAAEDLSAPAPEMPEAPEAPAADDSAPTE